MKKRLSSGAVFLAVMFAFSSGAFAATAEETLAKCKSSAKAREIPAADLEAYLTDCMLENGVAPDQVNKLLDAEFSSKDSAKPAK